MAELQLVKKKMINMNCILKQSLSAMACDCVCFNLPHRREDFGTYKIICNLLRQYILSNFRKMKNLYNSSEL